MVRGVEKVLISDKAKMYFLENYVHGVAGLFVDKPQSNEYIVYSEDRQYNIYNYLNTERGSDTCIISESSAKKLGILHSPNH